MSVVRVWVVQRKRQSLSSMSRVFSYSMGEHTLCLMSGRSFGQDDGG